MNRTQLPIEVKEVVCQQVLAGWKVEAAAEATSYSIQSIKRWLTRYQEGGFQSLERRRSKPSRKAAPKSLSSLERRAVEDALAQHPHLRTRSLRDYLLRHHQLDLSRRQLERYLRKRGLVEPAGKKCDEGPPRRFEAPEPLAMIQMDVMYVAKSGGGHFYIADVIDDHSRFLLGSVALEEQTGEKVLEVLRGVVEQWGVPQAVLTDRGTQFVHWRGRTRFQEYVEEELGARHILAATQHPQTIGKIERLHATVRKEKLRKKGSYQSLEALQTDLDDYSNYYNYERPHQGIGGVTPADRFFGMGKATETALKKAAGTEEGVFLTANLMGRRLVLAGPDVNSLQVLWSDGTAAAPSRGHEPEIW